MAKRRTIRESGRAIVLSVELIVVDDVVVVVFTPAMEVLFGLSVQVGWKFFLSKSHV